MSFQTSSAESRHASGVMTWRGACGAEGIGPGRRGGYSPLAVAGLRDRKEVAQVGPADAPIGEAGALRFARDAAPRGGGGHGAQAGAGFGPGTMVKTQDGEVPVEWLATGDRVLTLDHGFQPILWIGRSLTQPGHAEEKAGLCPVCIPAGTLSDDSPSHDLIVMADHRVLVASPWAELYHLSSEVLVPAAVWAQEEGPLEPQSEFTVTQLLFARHEIICAQGAWVESMCLTEAAEAALAPAARDRVRAALGPDPRPQETARPSVTPREARLLVKAAKKSVALPERNRA